MYKILVCDDDENIVRALRAYLEEDGYDVVQAFNGSQALDVLRRETVHLVLMDVMMPRTDGITALVELRKTSNVPVILLTAKSEYSDKVLGLNVGADDYITKPFNRDELLARVRSQMRRYIVLGNSSEKSPETLRCGGVEMDDASKTVTVDGANVELTPTEYKMLQFFLTNPGKVLSHKEIYQHVWEDEPYGSSSTVLVHIRHLRQKIEIDPANPRYILSVWGHGYKMDKGTGV